MTSKIPVVSRKRKASEGPIEKSFAGVAAQIRKERKLAKESSPGGVIQTHIGEFSQEEAKAMEKSAAEMEELAKQVLAKK